MHELFNALNTVPWVKVALSGLQHIPGLWINMGGTATNKS